MIKRTLIPIFACLFFGIICANEVDDEQNQTQLPAKESIVATLSAPDLNPRTLQVLANAFYWSHQAKKYGIIATTTAKRNMLLADHILLKSYNLEYAHEERILTVFKELHESWQKAHAMQRAQNACVGILSFKEEVNDIANAILTRMCSDAAARLLEKKDAVLERAQKLHAAQAKNHQQDELFTSQLEEFYTTLHSQNLDEISPAMRTVNNYTGNLILKHLHTIHGLHDIRVDIMSSIDQSFADEFLGWYRVIYTILQDRGLLDTPFGTIMCDDHGLIEEENRTQLPHPESLTLKQ